jgi:hypothetical protein
VSPAGVCREVSVRGNAGDDAVAATAAATTAATNRDPTSTGAPPRILSPEPYRPCPSHRA